MKEGNQIGLVQATAYTVGDIIGSGIFVSPAAVFLHAQSIGLSLIVWVAGALIATTGCLVYVELGTKIRKSGCDFAYLTHAQWEPVAVTFLYVSCLLIYPSILSIQTMTFGEYVVQGLDKLMCLESAYKEALQRLVGFIALWLICCLNLFSLRSFAARFQLVVTISKFVVMGVIILTGLYYLFFKGGSSAFNAPFAGSSTKPGSFVLALYASLFAYNGWDICCFGTEEISNPRKTLPIAGIVGIASAALCYVLMNVAYFSVLTIEDFTTTDAVAVVFAEKTLGDLHYVVPFLVACLLLGNLNSTVFGCSRYVISGAKNGYFPSFLRTVHPLHNSPRAAVLIEVWIAIGLSFLGNLDQLLVYMSFAMWSQRLIVQMALLWMRYRGFSYPKDAFVVPIVLPVVFLGVCVALLVIPIVQDYRVALYAGLMMAVGLLVYFAFIFRRQSVQLPVLRKIDHALTVAAQVLLETELESDKNA